MSRINSKSKPMPEDFEPRFKLESVPERLIDKYSVMQESYLYIDGDWHQIGRRFSQMASHKISKDALDHLEKTSKDRVAIKKLKEVERAKRMKKKT